MAVLKETSHMHDFSNRLHAHPKSQRLVDVREHVLDAAERPFH
jgi:hypothetical protein